MVSRLYFQGNIRANNRLVSILLKSVALSGKWTVISRSGDDVHSATQYIVPNRGTKKKTQAVNNLIRKSRFLAHLKCSQKVNEVTLRFGEANHNVIYLTVANKTSLFQTQYKW